MKIEQATWKGGENWLRSTGPTPAGALNGDAQLVLAFGGREVLREGAAMRVVADAYPNAQILGCSTAGEITGTHVSDDSLSVTAVGFERTPIAVAKVDLSEVADSFEAGRLLASRLDPRDLVHVLIFSDGLRVNGSQLIKALAAHLPAGVSLSGGLSADGARFEKTLVCCGDGEAREQVIAAIGFYGTHMKVRCASRGGWNVFGPERIITRASGNVLYELDGRCALDLYKAYLGDQAAGLPASGLRFPLSIRRPEDSAERAIVRTMLSVNEAEQSIRFAGDMPEGWYARLMRANFERLIDGAQDAAQATKVRDELRESELALIISCVGRKLILKQRVEEEVEAVRDVLGPDTAITGFYSYGEISPLTPTAACELHNQTLAITTFSER